MQSNYIWTLNLDAAYFLPPTFVLRTSRWSCSAPAASSQPAVFFSHTTPAAAYSHQPINGVFLSHHFSSRLQHQHSEQVRQPFLGKLKQLLVLHAGHWTYHMSGGVKDAKKEESHGSTARFCHALHPGSAPDLIIGGTVGIVMLTALVALYFSSNWNIFV